MLVQPRALRDREFRWFQELIYREAGIHLSPLKKALVAGRLARRLRELGLATYEAYFRRVEEDAIERVTMLDFITTNETRFFREAHHFDFLERQVFPAWRREAAEGRRPRRLRAWSAGCSSGEEPYTLAMLLRHHFGEAGWELQVLATDLSTRVLDRAANAVYPLERARDVPERFRRSCLLRGTGAQAGRMRIAPEVRSLVRFERVNLNEARWPVGGPFDLVFCRNVLIYFDERSRARAVDRLLDQLAPAGYFFLGHAESLNGVTQRVRSVLPTVYAHVPQALRAGAA